MTQKTEDQEILEILNEKTADDLMPNYIRKEASKAFNK